MQENKLFENKDIAVYTVTELDKAVRVILDDHFDDVWVEGEVSNFKTYPSGHSYFSLKDENSLLRAVLFKYNNANIKFGIEDGMHVLCNGRVSFYEKSG